MSYLVAIWIESQALGTRIAEQKEKEKRKPAVLKDKHIIPQVKYKNLTG